MRGWWQSLGSALLVGTFGLGCATAQAGAKYFSNEMQDEMQSAFSEEVIRASIEELSSGTTELSAQAVAIGKLPHFTSGIAIAPNATATRASSATDPNAWAFSEDEEETADEIWAAEHLRLSSRFAAPFQGERIYPRIAFGTSFMMAQGETGGLNQFVGQLDLSLYWIDLHIPYVNMLDDQRLPTRIRVDLKVPIPVPIDSASRFALMGGATFSDEYPQLIDSLRFQVAWGYGGEVLSFQVRGGYGYRQPYDESAMKKGFLYGSTIGLNLGPIQPLLEVDGVRFDDLSGQVDFIPGIRFYPLDTPSLRFGIAAIFTLTHDVGETVLKRKRYGTMFQLSYDFI